MCKRAYEIAKSKGWHETDRPIPEYISNIHAEVSEAFEEYRKGNMRTQIGTESLGCIQPLGFYSELADVVIRIADLFESKGRCLSLEIQLKMDYNETRSHRHGNKKA